MDEKAVFCLLFSVLGTAVLFALASSAVPPLVFPDQLSPDQVGSLIAVTGRLTWVSEADGNVFLFVCRSSCVQVAVFSPLARQMRQHSFDPYSAKPGSPATVEGILQERGGNFSIVPLGHDSIDYG